jgi:hypothetical protein
MAKDDRDILEVLKAELSFLENNGYARSARMPWQAKSAFQDSLTCINYGHPYRAHPCNECHLLEFVNPENQGKSIPCHFIPLNEKGDTIDSLELEENERKLEQSLKDWLKVIIHGLEEDRSQLAMAGCP